MKSKIISISAISSALVSISLLLGVLFEFAELISLVIASVFVMLPLYRKSYLGSVLTYLVGGVIAFLFTFKITSVVYIAYFVFFGIYPIIKFKVQDKNVNKYFWFIIGLIWCIIAVYGVYFYYLALIGPLFDGLPQWVISLAPYLLSVIGAIFFVIFDRYIKVMRIMIDRYLSKIIK